MTAASPATNSSVEATNRIDKQGNATDTQLIDMIIENVGAIGVSTFQQMTLLMDDQVQESDDD